MTSSIDQLRQAVDDRFAHTSVIRPDGVWEPDATRVLRVAPRAAAALTMCVATTPIGGVEDCGAVLAVEWPDRSLACVGLFPDCGCDACDSGSANELEHLDRHIAGIVNGTFRLLRRGNRQIMVIDGEGWSATNVTGRSGRQIEAILVHPRGWDELTGRSWLG